VLPDRDKSTLAEKLTQVVIGRIVGGVAESARRFVKRAVRIVVLALVAVTMALLGIVFLAIGAVKWFSILMPSWLAWSVVGIILLLLGVVLGLATLISSRI
jgi:hypothetical protein